MAIIFYARHLNDVDLGGVDAGDVGRARGGALVCEVGGAAGGSGAVCGVAAARDRAGVGDAAVTRALPAWRSLLYVPASAEKFVAKAHERGADVVILDLEDGVAPEAKDAARAGLITQPQADELDAVLCLAMAAWAWQRRDSGWGLPADIDPVEGWVLGAPA